MKYVETAYLWMLGAIERQPTIAFWTIVALAVLALVF